MGRRFLHDESDLTTPPTDVDTLRAILRLILTSDQQVLLDAFSRIHDSEIRQAIMLITRQAAEAEEAKRTRTKTEIAP
jgi:hypothetical protein